MITLATLHLASAQEVFDQSKNHLLKQMKRSTKDNGNCLYRNPLGLMCAAGCFISEGEYKIEMDAPAQSDWQNLVSLGLVPKNHSYLITTLQQIHDSFMPAEWEEELIKLAEAKKLVWAL